MIDEDRLKELCAIAQNEFPDVDPYFIYIYATDFLLQEQGIFADKDLVEEMLLNSKDNGYSVEVINE